MITIYYQLDVIKIWDDEKYKYEPFRKLMKEILGYTDLEIDACIQRKFDVDYAATNLTLEEAFKIAQPFKDYGLGFCLCQYEGNKLIKVIAWNDIGGLQPSNPKDHYYDRPVVDRSHLWDMVNGVARKYGSPDPVPSKPVKPSKPVVECPYCHSTNTYKISGFEKAVNTGIFGLFGTKRHKQWSCKDCKSDF